MARGAPTRDTRKAIGELTSRPHDIGFKCKGNANNEVNMSLPRKVKTDSKSNNEKNDCAVKAVAIVTNMPYPDIHERMAANGRVPRKGTPMSVTLATLKGLNVWAERVPVPIGMTTVNRIGTRYLRKGRYLVRTSRHILAVVNGEVMDWTDGRRHRPLEVYKISF